MPNPSLTLGRPHSPPTPASAPAPPRSPARLIPSSPSPSLSPQAGSESGGGSKRSALREVALLALPTAFDLVATVLMNVGLLYVTASVYQMMRGAEMLFAAAFAITFLGRRLNRFHAMGIVCCVVGGIGGRGGVTFMII